MALIQRGGPALIPRGGNVLGFSLNVPQIPCGINVEYFFDRAAVRNALKPAVHKALYKAGSVVFQLARRSIVRKGMAAPKLKVMNTYGNLSLRQISQLQSTRTETAGVNRDSRGRFLRGSGARRSIGGQITEADRQKVLKRIAEIKAKEQSPPGTPPHTHRGNLRDRPGIVFAFDKTSESVVIGPMLVDATMTRIAYLHEFGGSQRMRAWMWVPRWPRSYRTGIVGHWPVGTRPAKGERWAMTETIGTFRYPARPYMRPAMMRAIESGRIAKEFENKFSVGG